MSFLAALLPAIGSTIGAVGGTAGSALGSLGSAGAGLAGMGANALGSLGSGAIDLGGKAINSGVDFADKNPKATQDIFRAAGDNYDPEKPATNYGNEFITKAYEGMIKKMKEGRANV